MGPTANVNHQGSIKETILESSRVLAALAENTSDIERAAGALISCYKKGGKMVLFGNGGSAADAQHLATELLGGFTNHDRPSLPAIALTTDTSALTAIGNDYDFEQIFSRQAEAMVNQGDVAIAISTSGNSKNIIRGAQSSKKRGATVIGFTGQTGGNLKKECDICICIPSTNTAHIQEAHITVGHILCALVETALAVKV
jgi:D-sedoheptulose 7-phosphate isomerase